MKTIEIQSSTGTSQIMVGASWEHLSNFSEAANTVIISDQNVARLYRRFFPPCPVIEIGTGENNKTLAAVESIYRQLLDLGIDRSSFITAVGGGITCDIAGFTASTYLRGVAFGYVATSLLAQADAAAGGKTGINFQGFKNMIGVFNHPRFVICDTSTLHTLPQNELANGFAEIIKHACIGSYSLVDFLEKNHRAALSLDENIIQYLVSASLEIKAAIVNRDEKEKGERRILNFGHTLGHALEQTTGISHGQAVSIGMVLAARLSRQRGILDRSAVEMLVGLLEKYGLPTQIEAGKDALMDALGHGYALAKDKKREGGRIHFVLLRSLGEAFTEAIPIHEIEEAIYDLC